MRLAKAGICFTFPAHKVKIRNSLRLRPYAVQPFPRDGPTSIPEERTFDAFSNSTVNNWFTFGGLQC
ncbi:hypothetical protein DP180_02780 [Enterobacter kobei]|uniref:Uncharacterized protein n=1 Tax=Enterobacter kobei TaxID=208224 RepID=A0ABX9F282_9ENTR|nr:hypothetical protein D9T11_06125 [Enterobacter kobei]PYZ34460.1 hypothetical protein DNK77_20685 [Enterobacter cloacae complex sp.]RGD12118.1 hypothetical protein DW197_13490 [Enterobacter sp. AM17-18]PWR28533.1 hypothetical protein DK504_10065 [Enterobacter kobei]RAY25110.1 hypothetical protein DP180_02780 [Enterobacter kobei]